ncbi:MAG: copper resistance protein B [Thermoanaerobaculales bacterium]
MLNRCIPLFAAVVVLLPVGPVLAQTEHNPSGAPEGWPAPIHDAQINSLVLFDQLEYRDGDGPGALGWDLLSWIGGDSNRLWVETEGQALTEDGEGEIERLDVLYGHLIAPFWDVQAGLSYQRAWGSGPDADRVSAVIGLQGLAPYAFEVDTNLRISQDGDVSADIQATYDLLFTQRLVLQSRIESVYAFQTVEEFGVGRGLNSLGLGFRLRYEIRRELAPYLGLTWSRRYGETADLARAEGNDPVGTAVVAGLRLWF